MPVIGERHGDRIHFLRFKHLAHVVELKRLVNLAGRLAIRVSPNPVFDDKALVTIEAYERGLHTLRVVDLAGQTVFSTTWQHMPGQHAREQSIDASAFGAGLYHLILETPTRRRVEPLSVVR